MKKYIIILIILFSCLNIKAQDQLKEHFLNDLQVYTEAFNNKEWNTVVKMMHPSIYDYCSKEEIIFTLDQIQYLGIDVQTKINSITYLSQIVHHKKLNYYNIEYKGRIKIKLSGFMSMASELIKPQIDKEFGSKNVLFDEENLVFTINAIRSIIAVNSSKHPKWRYIDIESKQFKNIEKSIPPIVLGKLKKGKN